MTVEVKPLRLPLVFGVKGIMLLTFLFTLVWLTHAVIVLIWVLLITGRSNLERELNEGVTDQWSCS